MPIAGRYTWREFTIPAASVDALMLPSNPMRVSWTLSIPTIGDAFVSTTGSPSAAQGIRLSGGDTPLSFTYHDHGDLVMGEWRITCNAANDLTCIEVLELPQGYYGV